MKMVITGGRDYEPSTADYDIFVALLKFFNPEIVIHGGARGVDSWAGRIAADLGYEVEVHRPDYGKSPKYAPLVRNTTMARRAQGGVCVAFTGGSGTGHMIGQAKKYSLRVIDLRR